MKKVKRILAMLMAMAMVLGMAVTTSAEEPAVEPTVAKKATATIKGVEEGATVTAYQLVSYNEKGEYVVVDAAEAQGYAVGMTDAAIVNKIAGNTGDLSATPLNWDPTDSTYKNELLPGTYLILVDKTGPTVYNPMLVSINVEYPNGAQPGEVDAGTDYMVNDVVAYAKKTDDIPFDKKITDETGNVIGTNGKYDDVYAGTTVYFELTGKIPSYSPSYTNAKYTLKDTVSEGIDLPADTATKIAEQLDADAATVTVENSVITIEFTTEYILANGGKDITIKYPATVNGTASNFNPATNTLELDYSNSPDGITSGTPVVTKHYTFDLNNELKKVDEDNHETPLKDAEFTLTSTTDATKVFTSKSNGDGYISFKGLDAGTYILKETKAPAGYALSGVEYVVEIAPEYDENNDLVSYVVTVKEKTEEHPEGEVIATITHTKDTTTGTSAEIINTTLAALPSTGGIGTYIFTIAGIIIMAAAAGFFFVSRRKANR